jgi:hypothetical protein
MGVDAERLQELFHENLLRIARRISLASRRWRSAGANAALGAWLSPSSA